MDCLISIFELGTLTRKSPYLKKLESINVDTYAYLFSRAIEAALKGETFTIISTSGLSGVQEIIDMVRECEPNGIHMSYTDIHETELRIQWRIIF